MTSIIEQAQRSINKAMDIHPTVVYVGSNPSGSIKVWIVAGHAGDYAVYEECGAMHCTCEAGQRGIVCYHRGAVLIHKLEREAYEAFSKALDQSIAERARMDEEEDAALSCAVGAWFLDHKAQPKPCNKATALPADTFDYQAMIASWQPFPAA